MRRFLGLAGCALIAAASPAAAQQNSNAAQSAASVKQLGDYIRTPDHLRLVGAAITAFEPVALAANCKDVKPVKGRSWKPVEEPKFDGGSKVPTAGAWQESWDVNACGKAGVRTIGFVVKTTHEVVPVPMFPGESLADLTTQLEAGRVALETIAPGTLPCADKEHIQVVYSQITNRADIARGRWSERWTVAGCSRVAAVDVNFAPGPGGKPSYDFQGRTGGTGSR